MAENYGKFLTLADFRKQLDPRGDVARVSKILDQSNELNQYAPNVEANGVFTHTETIEAGLPEVYYISINQGAPPSKAVTAQVTEGLSVLTGRSIVHRELVIDPKKRAAMRAYQADRTIAAMGQKDGSTSIYGNPKVDSKQYAGLAIRYATFAEANAQNIINGGGSDDLTSIYLLGLHPETIFFLYPAGASKTMGIDRHDYGMRSIQDPNGSAGSYMDVYEETFALRRGLCVKNWRYGVRICNVDTGDLIATSGTQATSAATNIVRLMARAREKPPREGGAGVRWVWLMNKTVMTGLQLLAMEKQSNVLTIEQGVDSFRMRAFGYPIACMDQILNTEAAVA